MVWGLRACWGWLLLVCENLGSCEAWAKTSHSCEKAPVNSLGGPINWVELSGDLQGGANSVSQADGWHQPAGSVALWGRGFWKGTAYLCMWEKAVPQVLPWCQTLHFLSVCHWCLSSCYPSAGTLRVSMCVVILRETAWDSRNIIHWLSACWFLQPEVMGIHLPSTNPGAGIPGVGSGPLAPEISLLNFYPEFLPMWNKPILCSTPSTSLDTSLDVCGFCSSIIVGLPFSSIHMVLFFFKDFICFYLFVFREEMGGRKRGRDVVASHTHTPYWGPGPHPGMCPDWELNRWPFGSQAHAQSTELLQPGPIPCNHSLCYIFPLWLLSLDWTLSDIIIGTWSSNRR